MSKMAIQIDLDFRDCRLNKIIKKYQQLQQNRQDKDSLKQKLQLQFDKKQERIQSQALHDHSGNKTQFLAREPFQLRQSVAIEEDHCYCLVHGKYYSFIRNFQNAVFGKASFNSFWRILQNENYKYWREDLRGSLAHELLNGGLLREIFKRLFNHVLLSAMRVSQPSISRLLECLQSQPTQISILERYIEWIH